MRVRPTARLVVLDDQQRILLLQVHDEKPLHAAYPDMRTYWILPGGGVEADEPFEQAAQRELWEETGIEVSAVGPCVWHFERILHLPRESLRLCERIFFVRVPASSVNTINMLPYEHETYRGFRWWRLPELAQSQESFLPPDLPRRLQPLLGGEIPVKPLKLNGDYQ